MPSAAPTLRTVQRWQTEFNRLADDQRDAYRFVRWPESFESDTLPWEASRAVLELLRLHVEWNWDPPTVRKARWFIRLFQAAPAAPLAWRQEVAGNVASWEARGQVDPQWLRVLELALLFGAWPGGENPVAYVAAAQDRGLPLLADLLRVSNTPKEAMTKQTFERLLDLFPVGPKDEAALRQLDFKRAEEEHDGKA